MKPQEAKQKPSLLFILNLFYPDIASTALLMTDLVRHLSPHFRITVITAEPITHVPKEAAKPLESVEIIQILLPKVDKGNLISRLRYVATFFLKVVASVLKLKRHDIVYTISQPPILGGLLGVICKLTKGSKFLYNIQDFNPEQARAAGVIKNKILLALLTKTDNIACRLADHIVVVGSDLRDTLLARVPARRELSIINNWVDENRLVPMPKEHHGVSKFIQDHSLAGKFVVMYSGNLGLYYDLMGILRVIERLKHLSTVQFVFVGDGALKPKMLKFVSDQGLSNVTFVPYQDNGSLLYSLNAADAHLVINQAGIKGVSVPSKIYGVMSVGKYVIGVLEAGSEARNILEAGRFGVVSEPGDYEGFYRNILKVVNMNSGVLQEAGMRGRNLLVNRFAMENSLGAYAKVLHRLS